MKQETRGATLPEWTFLPGSLRRAWFAWAALFLLLVVGVGLLAAERSAGWLVTALGIAAYQLWFLGKSLGDNRREGRGELLAGLGWGTSLTLFRGALIAMLAGYAAFPGTVPAALNWFPGVLYLAAAMADFLDGMLARLQDHATILGTRLDLMLDGLGVLAASVLVVRTTPVSAWFVFIGAVRYLYLGLLWLCRTMDLQLQPLPESRNRRFFAGVMMGLLGVLLIPAWQEQPINLTALLIAIPFLAGFVRDALVATGAVSARVAANFLSWLQILADAWLLPLARIIAAALGVYGSVLLISDEILPALAMAIVSVLVLLGLIARSASLVLIIALNSLLLAPAIASIVPIEVLNAMLILCAGIFLFGSGRLSLAAWDEAILMRRLGDR